MSVSPVFGESKLAFIRGKQRHLLVALGKLMVSFERSDEFTEKLAKDENNPSLNIIQPRTPNECEGRPSANGEKDVFPDSEQLRLDSSSALKRAFDVGKEIYQIPGSYADNLEIFFSDGESYIAGNPMQMPLKQREASSILKVGTDCSGWVFPSESSLCLLSKC